MTYDTCPVPTSTTTMILDLNSMYFYVLKLNTYFFVPQPSR